jgi:hypothetical protein
MLDVVIVSLIGAGTFLLVVPFLRIIPKINDKPVSLKIFMVTIFIAFYSIVFALAGTTIIYISVLGREPVINYISDLIGFSSLSMSDEQSIFESKLINIKNLYSDENNEFNRTKARAMYEEYQEGIGDGINVIDRICRIEYIGERLVSCFALQSNIKIKYGMPEYRAINKYDFEPNEKVFFCGRLGKEYSFTTSGGINEPVFSVKNSFIYKKKGGCVK